MTSVAGLVLPNLQSFNIVMQTISVQTLREKGAFLCSDGAVGLWLTGVRCLLRQSLSVGRPAPPQYRDALDNRLFVLLSINAVSICYAADVVVCSLAVISRTCHALSSASADQWALRQRRLRQDRCILAMWWLNIRTSYKMPYLIRLLQRRLLVNDNIA